MDAFLHQVLAGLATGGIYASLALALVMIYQATHLVNFAQGEMAMFATYLGWSLLNAGVPYWPAFLLTIGIAFVAGIVIERVVVRPVENSPVLAIVVVFIALLVILNSVAGWIYTYTLKSFPSPFPPQAAFKYMSPHEIGAIGITLVVLAALYAFFRFARVGIAMQATSQNQLAAYYMGIPVQRLNGLVWGLSAGVAALAGLLLAPFTFVHVNMGFIGLKAFPAAVVGGFGSLPGAIVGGLIIGVIEALAGFYLPEGFKDIAAYVVVLLMLVIKPNGLFGGSTRKKV